MYTRFQDVVDNFDWKKLNTIITSLESAELGEGQVDLWRNQLVTKLYNVLASQSNSLAPAPITEKLKHITVSTLLTTIVYINNKGNNEPDASQKLNNLLCDHLNINTDALKTLMEEAKLVAGTTKSQDVKSSSSEVVDTSARKRASSSEKVAEKTKHRADDVDAVDTSERLQKAIRAFHPEGLKKVLAQLKSLSDNKFSMDLEQKLKEYWKKTKGNKENFSKIAIIMLCTRISRYDANNQDSQKLKNILTTTLGLDDEVIAAAVSLVNEAPAKKTSAQSTRPIAPSSYSPSSSSTTSTTIKTPREATITRTKAPTPTSQSLSTSPTIIITKTKIPTEPDKWRRIQFQIFSVNTAFKLSGKGRELRTLLLSLLESSLKDAWNRSSSLSDENASKIVLDLANPIKAFIEKNPNSRIDYIAFNKILTETLGLDVIAAAESIVNVNVASTKKTSPRSKSPATTTASSTSENTTSTTVTTTLTPEESLRYVIEAVANGVWKDIITYLNDPTIQLVSVEGQALRDELASSFEGLQDLNIIISQDDAFDLLFALYKQINGFISDNDPKLTSDGAVFKKMLNKILLLSPNEEMALQNLIKQQEEDAATSRKKQQRKTTVLAVKSSTVQTIKPVKNTTQQEIFTNNKFYDDIQQLPSFQAIFGFSSTYTLNRMPTTIAELQPGVVGLFYDKSVEPITISAVWLSEGEMNSVTVTTEEILAALGKDGYKFIEYCQNPSIQNTDPGLFKVIEKVFENPFIGEMEHTSRDRGEAWKEFLDIINPNNPAYNPNWMKQFEECYLELEKRWARDYAIKENQFKEEDAVKLLLKYTVDGQKYGGIGYLVTSTHLHRIGNHQFMLLHDFYCDMKEYLFQHTKDAQPYKPPHYLSPTMRAEIESKKIPPQTQFKYARDTVANWMYAKRPDASTLSSPVEQASEKLHQARVDVFARLALACSLNADALTIIQEHKMVLQKDLKPGDTLIPNTFYIGESEGKLTYSMITPKGVINNFTTDIDWRKAAKSNKVEIDALQPLTLAILEKSKIKPKLLDTALNEGHVLSQSAAEANKVSGNSVPFVATLSGGGRNIIRIPRLKSKDEDPHRFKNWVLGGENNVSSSRSNYVATLEGKPVCKRYAGTHKFNKMGFEGKGTDKKDVIHGNFYGFNVGFVGPDGFAIESGGFGHVFILYQPPTIHAEGRFMFGVEGSAPPSVQALVGEKVGIEKLQMAQGILSRSGATHDSEGTSSEIGVTDGKKWRDLDVPGFQPSSINGLDTTITPARFELLLQMTEKDYKEDYLSTPVGYVPAPLCEQILVQMFVKYNYPPGQLLPINKENHDLVHFGVSKNEPYNKYIEFITKDNLTNKNHFYSIQLNVNGTTLNIFEIFEDKNKKRTYNNVTAQKDNILAQLFSNIEPVYTSLRVADLPGYELSKMASSSASSSSTVTTAKDTPSVRPAALTPPKPSSSLRTTPPQGPQNPSSSSSWLAAKKTSPRSATTPGILSIPTPSTSTQSSPKRSSTETPSTTTPGAGTLFPATNPQSTSQSASSTLTPNKGDKSPKSKGPGQGDH